VSFWSESKPTPAQIVVADRLCYAFDGWQNHPSLWWCAMPFVTRVPITAHARSIVRPHNAATLHRNAGDDSSDQTADGGDGFHGIGGEVPAGDFVEGSNRSSSSCGAAIGTAMAMGTSRSVKARGLVAGSLAGGRIRSSPRSSASSGSTARTEIGRTERWVTEWFSSRVLLWMMLVLLLLFLTKWVLLAVPRSGSWEAATVVVVGRSFVCCSTECNGWCLVIVEIIRSFVRSVCVVLLSFVVELDCVLCCVVLCWKNHVCWQRDYYKHSESIHHNPVSSLFAIVHPYLVRLWC